MKTKNINIKTFPLKATRLSIGKNQSLVEKKEMGIWGKMETKIGT
ncbi:MAG: hypothetical protein PHW15_01775 [Patescibacteria group bacterium]|nr:hypothetical protein [Patescibacteria group bacterium]